MGRRSVLLLAFSLQITGCGSYVTQPAQLTAYPGPTETHGVVCVVRDDFTGPPASVPVWDNGVLVGANGPASHFCYLAEVGEHVISSELVVTAERRVQLAPGGRAWLRQDVGASPYYRSSRSGVRLGRAEWVRLEPMSEEAGARALRDTVRHVLVGAPAGEVLERGRVAPRCDERRAACR